MDTISYLEVIEFVLEETNIEKRSSIKRAKSFLFYVYFNDLVIMLFALKSD